MLHHYLMNQEAVESGEFSAVPVTMKHFRILARLGRAPVSIYVASFFRN